MFDSTGKKIATLLCGLALAGAAAIGAGGCTATHEGCGEYCERSAACDGAPDATLSDCQASCSSTEAAAKDDGCEAQFDEYVECLGHASQVCDAALLAEECKIQIGELDECAAAK
ncbi:MAG: hypothetical protein R3B70_44715 [Polyangiaceae bacterium]